MRARVVGSDEDTRLLFWCPGCRAPHMARIGGSAPGTPWAFNGDLDAPSLEPSFLSTWEGIGPDGTRTERRCHLWLREGILEFLPDSTHGLVGTFALAELGPPWDTA